MNVGQSQRTVRQCAGLRRARFQCARLQCASLQRGGHGSALARAKRRWGAAAVEAAVSLPLLILLVFGAIEVASGVFLSQTLAIAAYEGARAAARPGGTSAAAEQRVIELLSSRNVAGYEIWFEPAVTEETEPGTAITVTVQAPLDALAGPWLGLLSNRNAAQQACMIKH